MIPNRAEASIAEAPRPRPRSRLAIQPFRGERSEWDAFAEAAEGGTFCHLWAWRDLMEEVLGHPTLYLEARDEAGKLQGLLPLVEVRSRLTGRYLLSLPFLNYGGALGTPEARRALSDRARREAEERKVDLLELRARSPVSTSLQVNRRKVTVLLDLPDDPEVLWKEGIPSKLRNQIRRPRKAGMELRVGAGELPAFYRVFARTMRDLGTPVLPRSLFEGMRDELGPQVRFAAVYHDEVPVAAGCGFLFRGEFEITWAGFLREHSREAPNMLLYWGLMERMIGEGVRVFNFGRCTPGSGTHRFKKQWGGRDESLPWLQWSRGGEEATPDHERRLLRIASSLWSRLPLPVATRMGPFFARRLP